jgi:phosphatidylserine/phosphatidylglycerophosphate/cardiolipin synthase-like enzyme
MPGTAAARKKKKTSRPSASPASSGKVQVTFLRDISHGGKTNQPQSVAAQFTDYVQAAKRSIHIAIYDFRLTPALGGNFVDALISRAKAGVDVKIAYDHTKPNAPTAQAFAKLGGDPAPKGTDVAMRTLFANTKVKTKPVLTIPAAVANQPVETDPIAGSHLMHSKYIIRDGSFVLTGSTNFTDDAWSHQENNILEIPSTALAGFYEKDFQQLWSTGNIKSTGAGAAGSVTVGGTAIDVHFSPGDGPTIDSDLAALISSAKKRIAISSMVITSHLVLAALSDAMDAGIELTGIYDGAEMNMTAKAWEKSGSPELAVWQKVSKRLVEKHSNSFTPTGLHNFMHNKVAVCDAALATGSFNFSKSATMNAENSLIIHDSSLANQYASYIADLVAAYK